MYRTEGIVFVKLSMEEHVLLLLFIFWSLAIYVCKVYPFRSIVVAVVVVVVFVVVLVLSACTQPH